jgi:hypothetical protein
MNGARMALRLAVGAGLTGGALAMAAAPAFAAASLTVSPSGTLTSDGTVTANGTDSGDSTAIGQSRTLTLQLDTPDGQSKQWSSGSVPSTRNASVSGSFSTAGGVNGSYTFTLKVNSSTADTKTVVVRVPPAPVSGFGGHASGTVAHFTWNANGEPDLAGYDLVDTTGGGRRDLTPGGVGTNVCSGGSCAVDIDFGSGAQGSTHTFVIDALRYTSPAHSSTVASNDSSPTSVDFPAPPPSSTPSSSPSTASSSDGTPSASSSAGGSGSAGGATSSPSGQPNGGGSAPRGGSSAGHGAAGGGGRTISASHPSAALRAYLPTFSAGAAPNLPSVVTEVKPLPEGTYKPTLAYPDQVVSEAVHRKGMTPVAEVRDQLVRVLDVGALWKSVAAAALVLLMAAHLRAWVTGADPQD